MKFVIYKDSQKQWRWRLKAANGRIVAASGEGYRRRSAMLRTINRIAENFRRFEPEIVFE